MFSPTMSFNRDTLHVVHSVSKSFMSTLAGLASRDGYIASDSESILGFFPEHAGHLAGEKERILLRHLMTTTTSFISVAHTGYQGFESYGYHRWRKTFHRGTVSLPAICADGFAGQAIMEFPTLGIVVVTSGNHHRPEREHDLVANHILPAAAGEGWWRRTSAFIAVLRRLHASPLAGTALHQQPDQLAINAIFMWQFTIAINPDRG